MSRTTESFDRKWILGERHPEFGVVIEMGWNTDSDGRNGEAWRRFVTDDGKLFSQFPLFMLQDDEPVSEGEGE